MAVTVKKDNNKYAVIGAGVRHSNYGSKEEPYIIGCDQSGKIELLLDFANNIEVIDIDGKKPEDLLR
ncbi:MAG: hypothetical protein K9M56_08325 [Victivallales bacterium]|nr:hypothetical protein [Victivallales bacterium]